MAGSPIKYYRNYDLSDTTWLAGSAGSSILTVESLGWSAPSGYQFKEWNSSQDGSGTSYSPGDSAEVNIFAIWEEESHEVQIIYNNSTIGSMDDSGTVLLQTSGKYCEGNITVLYTRYSPNLQSKQVSPTTSSQTVSPDSGYDGLSQVTVDAISPTKSAQTYTPTTTDQTIASGRWLTGTQTIKGDANLVASNIASGVSIFGVTGTHSGGGSNEDLNKIITRTVTSVTNSEVTYVGAYAFASCSSLTTASFPSCQVISSFAFQNCQKLTTISFPSCIFIYSSAFGNCYSLASVNFPSCQSIASYAFYNCSKLSTINFPACKTIGTQAFASCSSLTTVNFPSCSSINTYAFQSCYNLTTISFPAQSGSIGMYAFAKCSKLTSAIFSSCTYVGNYAFSYCSKLSIISFPICQQIGSLAFTYCLSLTTISFPSCSKIWNSAFYSCWNLVSLYLTGSSVAALASSNAFNSTPIAGYTTSTGGVYGSIFVPSSLYNTYISSTNWVYFSSRFVSV